MATLTYVKFEVFTEDLFSGVHNLAAAGHTLKLALTNVAPVAATSEIFGDLTEIAAGNGYTAGGFDIVNSISRTGGTTSLHATDFTITATGGAIATFRYLVVYNDTPTSPVDPLIAFFDHGSAVSLADTDTYAVDFGASLATLA